MFIHILIRANKQSLKYARSEGIGQVLSEIITMFIITTQKRPKLTCLSQ